MTRLRKSSTKSISGHDIIVIGASAGGIEAIQILFAGLPADLPASIFVVIHLPGNSASRLASILGAKTKLAVHWAENRKKFYPGNIYVAIPDRHLLIEGDQQIVVRGPKENRHRPAVDPLFRSAAAHYGDRTIGVILSGLMDDGTSGLWHLKRADGLAVVQEPGNAQFKQMPQSAIQNVQVDHIVPVEKMGELLAGLVKTPARENKRPISKLMKTEELIVKMASAPDAIQEVAPPSRYSCPECHGVLFEINEGGRRRYRCRTGHAYGEASLLADQYMRADEALWSALRALQEKVQLLKQQAGPRAKLSSAKLKKLAGEAEKQVIIVRELLQTLEGEKP